MGGGMEDGGSKFNQNPKSLITLSNPMGFKLRHRPHTFVNIQSFAQNMSGPALALKVY